MTEPAVEKYIPKTKSTVEKKEVGFYESLLQRLEKYQKKTVRKLKRKHKKAIDWLAEQGQDLVEVRTEAAKAVAGGTIIASLLTTTAAPIIAVSTPNIIPLSQQEEQLSQPQLLERVKDLINRKRYYKFTPQEERAMAHLISAYTNIQVAPELEGHRLRHIYGEIATERHMPIYHGQRLTDHLADQDERNLYGWTGMTAHPSAWGYFAAGKQEVSDEIIKNEKYYFAVQTFLIPNWSSKWPKEKEWFKFRKVLAINPETGQAAVGVIADSGPTTYTGRQFGGSPEIMDSLGLGRKKTLGNVFVLLINDPENKVPLGPVKIIEP